MMGADDPHSGNAASSLRLVGETLAATASLEHLARLIARHMRGVAGAERVAVLARDQTGRLRPVADIGSPADGGVASGDVVALPLLVRAEVEGVVVVQGAADRSTLSVFMAQSAWAIAAVRAAQGLAHGDAAAARARITGQVLHEVNNRLGAIQIYAYLLTERLRRAEDASGLEVASKLSAAVDRLGTSLAGLATSEVPAAGPRSPTDLEALVEGCVGSVADELAGHGVRVLREPGAAGSVLVHAPSLVEAVQHVLRELGAIDGASTRLTVTTERPSPQSAAIAIDCSVGVGRAAEALFSGEPNELGRALVRDVVERQAGTVCVSGTGGDGALIRLELGGAG
jgi:signal transduction histidine kinase